MSPVLASQLLYDSDQDTLFGVDEIARDTIWVSVRVYKSVKEGVINFEVWRYDWDPATNEEKSCYVQAFLDFEEAKRYASQLAQD